MVDSVLTYKTPADCVNRNYPSGATVCWNSTSLCAQGSSGCTCTPYCSTGLAHVAYQPLGYGPPDTISSEHSLSPSSSSHHAQASRHLMALKQNTHTMTSSSRHRRLRHLLQAVPDRLPRLRARLRPFRLRQRGRPDRLHGQLERGHERRHRLLEQRRQRVHRQRQPELPSLQGQLHAAVHA